MRNIKKLVILIDPIEGIKQNNRIEIYVHGRTQYTGSPVAIRDPISLGYIASYLDQSGYKTIILLKALMEDDEIISKIMALKDNLLAICFGLHSTYLVPKTLALAKRIKSKIAGVPIIVGGYHPTGDPAIVTESVIDYAVVGEGEKTCKELLDTIKIKGNLTAIRGISFKGKNGKIIITSQRKRLEFSKLPWPKRDEKIISLCQPGPLSYPSRGKVAQIAFSRGCPYACDFCVSPKMWGRSIKYRKPKDVVEEMEHLITRFGINNFFFCDLSFNGNKTMTMQLCKLIKQMKEKLKYDFGSHVMCNTTNINKEILLAMREANFWKIDYGIEDVLPDTLQRIKSFQNIRQIQSILDLTNNFGILTRALIMIGYPWESEKTMQQRKEKILNLPVDQLRLCFYVPFPGAKIYDKLKERIIVSYEDFSTDTPVIRCDGIKSENLKNSLNIILKTFYNSENYVKHIRNKCQQYPALAKSYYDFFEYLKNKELLQNDTYLILSKLSNISNTKIPGNISKCIVH